MAISNFKIGDIVTCIREDPSRSFMGNLGNKYEVLYVAREGLSLKPLSKESGMLLGNGVSPSRFMLIKKEYKVEYEDEWHLNDGAIEIPEDAEKLMNSEGTSVVAFRYVKKPEVIGVDMYLYAAGNSKSFTLAHGLYEKARAKLTITTTDGELTDIQWEKL